MTLRGLAAASILLAGLQAEPTFAQQTSLTIRGGEHPSYSRLVFPTVNSLAWELRNLGREARLVIPGTDTNFVTERVFDRVPRTRLLGLEATQSGTTTVISLRLGCECEVVAELDGANLILDIKDQTPEVENSDLPTNDEMVRPAPRPGTKDHKTTSNELPKEVPTDLAERLISQLNKAAEQGIIELSDDAAEMAQAQESAETQPLEDQNTPQVEDELLEPPIGLQAREQNLDGLEGFAEQVEESLAEAFSDSALSDAVRITIPEELVVPNDPQRPVKNRSETPEQDQTNLADHCVPDEVLDIAYWADERKYSEQVSALQSQVFGEFDTPDPEAVLSLARFFIFFGLGTEAKSLLSDIELDKFQSELLYEIAHTVEGNPHIVGGKLDKAAGCPGAVSLWRTAALDKTEDQPVSNSDEIIDIFAEYPIQVRRIIGPRLVQSFLIRGQVNAANQIFSIVERAAGYHGAQHELMRADLTRRNGDTKSAEELYWRLVYQNGEVSAKAATRLVASILDRRAQVPGNVIEVLETMAFELRGSEQGTELLLNAIKAKANSKNIRDALETTFAELNKTPDDSQTYFQALNKILEGLNTENVGALEFATLVFENLELLQSDEITDANKLNIAKGAVDIGLPNTALGLLGAIQNPENEGGADIMAQASLKVGQLQSLVTLENRSGSQEVAVAQARAFSRMGQHRQAIAALGNSLPEESETLNWRAGNWNEVASSDDVTRSLLSQYMLNRAEGSEILDGVDLENPEAAILARVRNEADITLEYVSAIQMQSKSVRSFLNDLISEM